MIQTVVIAVGISVAISAVFTVVMISKSAKALAIEVKKMFLQRKDFMNEEKE